MNSENLQLRNIILSVLTKLCKSYIFTSEITISRNFLLRHPFKVTNNEIKGSLRRLSDKTLILLD